MQMKIGKIDVFIKIWMFEMNNAETYTYWKVSCEKRDIWHIMVKTSYTKQYGILKENRSKEIHTNFETSFQL
jgi:hypothetical protein